MTDWLEMLNDVEAKPLNDWEKGMCASLRLQWIEGAEPRPLQVAALRAVWLKHHERSAP